MTANVIKALRLFNLFVIFVYTEACFRVPHVLEASLNGLNFKKIRRFVNIDTGTRVEAKAMGHHTRYLGEKSVSLSFFDPRVFSETKRDMTAALEKEGDGCPPKRPKLVDPRISVAPRPRDNEKQLILLTKYQKMRTMTL